jgi:hypothetical protein
MAKTASLETKVSIKGQVVRPKALARPTRERLSAPCLAVG